MKAVIEIPAGSQLKIEQDKATGYFKVDRLLPMPCPHNYGFIEGTMAPDGDALDIFILGERLPTSTTLDDYELYGYFSCLDNGVQDDKLVGVPRDRQYDTWEMVLEVGHYLRRYKPGFEVIRWNPSPADAEKLILDSKIQS